MRAERVNHINRHFSDKDNMRAHRVTHINSHFSNKDNMRACRVTHIKLPLYSDGFTHKDKQIRMGLSIMCVYVSLEEISKLLSTSIHEVCFALPNSVYPNAKLHYATFHLGLHCFPSNRFRSHQYYGSDCLI